MDYTEKLKIKREKLLKEYFYQLDLLRRNKFKLDYYIKKQKTKNKILKLKQNISYHTEQLNMILDEIEILRIQIKIRKENYE